MSDEPTPAPNLLLQPFTFDGWNGERLRNAPVDFDAAWIWRHDELAKIRATQGDERGAGAENQWALWWRGLKHLPAQEADRVVSDLWNDTTEQIDALLTLTEGPSHAQTYLSLIIEQAARGLNALAARGDKKAAHALVNSLLRATGDFNQLAFHKPEAFREVAEGSVGIPGMINRNKARAKANSDLVKKLAVGSKGILPQARPGAAARMATPRNLWAMRLWNYLTEAQKELKLVGIAPAELAPERPPWSAAVLLLPPLSHKTHPVWSAAAWEVVLDASGGRPQDQPALAALIKPAHRPRASVGKRGDPLKQDGNACADIKSNLKKGFKAVACAQKSSP